MSYHILIVDDETNICFTLGRFLADEGYQVATAEDFDTAIDLIDKNAFDLIYADILLKDHTGIDILKRVDQQKMNCPVIMITGVPSIETASEAVRLGAFDYLAKPVLQADLLKTTRSALKYKTLIDEKNNYKANLEAIFASAKDGLISVDQDLYVIEINQAATDICGLHRNQAIGKPLNELGLGCHVHCTRILGEAISTQASVEHREIHYSRSNGDDMVVTLTAAPLTSSGSVLKGGLLTIRDQTRLFVLERDLKKRHTFHNIIGKNEKIQQIFSLIETLADVKTTVLITGDSGTGKELIADAVHYGGADPDKPLVKVNCAALSENLLESELFGHIKGAFSGAVNDRIGRFERANGGTIFLDEVGEMSAGMQLRLLRVLQEQEFERVGDSKTIRVNVRVIAATNLDLLREVNANRFRKDLYYRLKVVELKLPALNDRKEDIPLLVNHFIGIFNKQFNRQIKGISQEVITAFMKYPWPGNIRELQHAVEHAFILCKDNMIKSEHIPEELLPENRTNADPNGKSIILSTLEKHRWNITKTAKELAMSRQKLYRKMKDHHISRT